MTAVYSWAWTRFCYQQQLFGSLGLPSISILANCGFQYYLRLRLFRWLNKLSSIMPKKFPCADRYKEIVILLENYENKPLITCVPREVGHQITINWKISHWSLVYQEKWDIKLQLTDWCFELSSDEVILINVWS